MSLKSSNSSKNWSETLKIPSKKSEWPKLKNSENKSDSEADAIEDLSKKITKLNIEPPNAEYEELSREQILENRKIRKQKFKDDKKLLDYEKKLIEIRAPKDTKIKMVDGNFVAKYLQTVAGDKFPVPKDETNMSKTMIKKEKFKNRGVIKCSLSDIIQFKSSVSKKDRVPVKKDVHTENKIVKRGKTREISKKSITSMKRNIINLRNERQKQRELTEVPEVIEFSDVPEVEASTQIINNNLHSRKFRPYCDNLITDDLCKTTEQLLKDLFRFQSRAYEKNQIKATAHRRYVVGFKETNRQLQIRKVKLLLIAPDLEPNEGEGGLDELVENLKATAIKFGIPYIFSVKRRRIGYLLFKKVSVGCVGILDYDGSEENVKKLKEIVNEERENYKKKCI